MRPHRTNGLLLLPLLFLLPAPSAAKTSRPGIERQTELVDPRDAAWFYRPERIESEKPEELLDLLGINEGDVVADIGAGPGLLFTTTAALALAFTAVLALALPASAQDAEVGQEYQITIATEEDNQYTGPYGQVLIGSIFVMVPDAKVDERYTVRVTAIAENQYSGNKQAACEFAQIGGNRTGMCLPAP